MDLSIIIVNWNTREYLSRVLETVQANSESLPAVQIETFVVDNLSRDGSAAMVRERFPWVRLIENQENGGFARGNNQAIRLSRGRFVLLLNPDTELLDNALGELLAFMERNPKVGGIGARILNPDGSLQPSCHPFPTLRSELWRLFHLDALYPYSAYKMEEWDTATARPTEALLGACLLVRRGALDEVGLLDESYFMYSEEVDLCYRLSRAGWALCWVPQARVIHHGGQSTRQAATEMFLHLYGAKVRYFRKHYGTLSALLYKLILLCASLPRLTLPWVSLIRRNQRSREHEIVMRHYWQLLLNMPRM